MSRSKNFLNPPVVNLSVCLFSVLFGYNFFKSKIMASKFWYVYELLRFAVHMKNCYDIVHRSFYRALQMFQYVNMFCSALMTQFGTKFWFVLKLYRSDSYTKISQRIQYIVWYRAFKNSNTFTFLMTHIGRKFQYVFK